MKLSVMICGAVAAAMVPVAAMADDPRDPTLRNATARARDSAATRDLNRREEQRARATGVRWRVVSDGGNGRAEDSGYAADYDRQVAQYRRDRDHYEQDVAAWRRTVAACEAGYYDACDNR